MKTAVFKANYEVRNDFNTDVLFTDSRANVEHLIQQQMIAYNKTRSRFYFKPL